MMWPVYTTPTVITKLHHLATYFKCELAVSTAVAYFITLVCMTCMNAKAMPTHYIEYSCHIKAAVELV